MDTSPVTTNPTSSGDSPAQSIMELTTLINRYVGDIQKIRDQMKMHTSMFNDAFENDADYHVQAEKVKDMNKLKQAAKQRIMKTPAMEALTAKVTELKGELKDYQEVLSGYLEQYQKVTGTNIIEGENGEIRQIIPVYRLVKKSKYNP
jgi:hypothetical protein